MGWVFGIYIVAVDKASIDLVLWLYTNPVNYSNLQDQGRSALPNLYEKRKKTCWHDVR